MSKEHLAKALAQALNLLNSLNNGEWSADQNESMRHLQDGLPEAVDLLVQDHVMIRWSDLIEFTGRDTPA